MIRVNFHLRHEASGDGLEGESQPREEARQVAPNAGAHSQQAREERDHGEEETNDDEGEHEPGRQEVMVGPVVDLLAIAPTASNFHLVQSNLPDKLLGNIVGRAEVTAAWGIEGEVGVRATAVTPTTGGHIADVPEGPTRGCRGPWDVARVGLEEVDLIQGCAIARSAQECEENEQDGTGREEKAEEAQRHSCYKIPN